MTDKKTKTQKVSDILNQADEVIEIGKAIAPPGARTAIQGVDDAVEIGKAGLSVWERLRGVFRKKK